MAINNLTGKNIQDTYQKVIQTDGTNIADGTGSLLPISFDGNNVIISGSLTATEYSVTSSVTNVIFQQQSGSTIFGDSIDDTHLFTGSLNISGAIISNDYDFLMGGMITLNAIRSQGNNLVFGSDHGSYPTTISSSQNLHLYSTGDIFTDIAGGDFRIRKSTTEYFRFNLDDNIATIDATGDLKLDPSGGDVYIDGNVTASGTITGLSGSFTHLTNVNTNNITASGLISSSGTGNNYFKGHVDSDGFFRAANGYGLYGYNTSGTGKVLAVMNVSNNVHLSNDDCITKLRGTSITIDAGQGIQIDADNGLIEFRDGGFSRIYMNTTSGHISASGNISASGKLIGIIDGGKF